MNEPSDDLEIKYLRDMAQIIASQDREFIFYIPKDFMNIREWVKEKVIYRPHVFEMMVDLFAREIYEESLSLDYDELKREQEEMIYSENEEEGEEGEEENFLLN